MRRRSRRAFVAGLACLPVLALLAAFPTAEGATAPQLEPIDINKATAEGLTAIPGIGAVMAERIVKWREEHGPFRRVEDLLKVKGIGEKSFDKLRPYVKVSNGK